MAVNNSLVKEKPKFSVAIQSDAYKNLINQTLGDPNRAMRFIASISSAVATNPLLQECDAGTIVSAALLGESLNLSPSPQLGQYYLVPFNNTKKGCKDAQFQLGYKGYIQLAIRSGLYKNLNVVAIKEGELVSYNPLTEELKANMIEDEEQRENAPTIGYYAMFEYLNGFVKSMYWSKAKMEAHADKYSQSFSLKAVKGREPKYDKVSFADYKAGKVKESDLWKYSSFWYKDFDGMAFKTMLRQLISKWGIMSIEMPELATALEKDMAVLNTNGSYSYVDNIQEEIEPPVLANGNVIPEEPAILVENNSTKEKVIPEEFLPEDDYEDPFK